MKKPKTILLRSIIKNLRTASIVDKSSIIEQSEFVKFNKISYSTRRKFLQDGAKALTGLGIASMLPLSSCDKGKSKSTQEKGSETPSAAPANEAVKIAIIGGGIAGLNCAYQLKKNHNIVANIYEGSNRIGGRIFTQEDVLAQGLTTEFGGEFIDSNHEDMLSLAKEFELEVLDFREDIEKNKLVKDTYFFNDKKYTEKDVVREFKKVAKKIEKDLKKCSENYDTEYCITLDNTSLEQYVRSLKCAKWLQDLLIYAYVAEFGLDANEQSSLNLIDMVGTDLAGGFEIFGDSDERYKIKGGNSKVVEVLNERLNGQIALNSRLLEIKNAGTKYLLSFENKKEVTADFVVLAIPFTVLRKVKLNIEGISDDKRKCINELGYGQNNKLVLGFNSRPWREKGYSGYLINTDIQNGWDSSQLQNKNSGAGGYTIFLGGAPSKNMADQAKEQNLKDTVPDSIVQNYLSKMDAIFTGANQQFNGKHKAALWSNNPFINASYACYKVGQWTTISGKEIEPIGNIFFAGEHCSSDFQGYMNGGAETGRRAAEELAKIVQD